MIRSALQRGFGLQTRRRFNPDLNSLEVSLRTQSLSTYTMTAYNSTPLSTVHSNLHFSSNASSEHLATTVGSISVIFSGRTSVPAVPNMKQSSPTTFGRPDSTVQFDILTQTDSSLSTKNKKLYGATTDQSHLTSALILKTTTEKYDPTTTRTRLTSTTDLQILSTETNSFIATSRDIALTHVLDESTPSSVHGVTVESSYQTTGIEKTSTNTSVTFPSSTNSLSAMRESTIPSQLSSSGVPTATAHPPLSNHPASSYTNYHTAPSSASSSLLASYAFSLVTLVTEYITFNTTTTPSTTIQTTQTDNTGIPYTKTSSTTLHNNTLPFEMCDTKDDSHDNMLDIYNRWNQQIAHTRGLFRLRAPPIPPPPPPIPPVLKS